MFTLLAGRIVGNKGLGDSKRSLVVLLVLTGCLDSKTRSSESSIMMGTCSYINICRWMQGLLFPSPLLASSEGSGELCPTISPQLATLEYLFWEQLPFFPYVPQMAKVSETALIQICKIKYILLYSPNQNIHH